MDFLGNISLRLVGLICTVGVMAGAYFFFVKPTLDTTSDAINSVSEPIRDVQKSAEKAQQQAVQQSKQQGGTGGAEVGGINFTKLQNCIQKAGSNSAAIQACTSRFGP